MVNVNVGDKVTLRYGRTVVTGTVTGVEYKESGNLTYVQLVVEHTLPTTPGTVLKATVRGVPDVLVVRTGADHKEWLTVNEVGNHWWHDSEHITDWKVVYTPEEEEGS